MGGGEGGDREETLASEGDIVGGVVSMASGIQRLSPYLPTGSLSTGGGGGKELIVGGVVSMAGGAVCLTEAEEAQFFYGGDAMDRGTSEWMEAEEAAEK